FVASALRRQPSPTLVPSTALFRSDGLAELDRWLRPGRARARAGRAGAIPAVGRRGAAARRRAGGRPRRAGQGPRRDPADARLARSEEHTSELQSRENLVCRLLLEK